MAAPNMAAITASLEKSFQNCSLNHQESSCSSSSPGGGGGMVDVAGLGRSATSNSPENHHLDATLELNSQISLPFHWEQCLDLKTGEIYYINWRTGMKVTEDPRTTAEYSGDLYSEDDCSSYDSEESSSEPSPSSSREQWNHNQDYHDHNQSNEQENLNVLVRGWVQTVFNVPYGA
ncbi:WW/Rsp5/WWP [Abeliophyllum distichum]|uniref:WW/Rsp5/WWP n=1 Tax=Abeliophyllum distichum TaxID=126358 RepID=A0ABD1W158_9LAMI